MLYGQMSQKLNTFHSDGRTYVRRRKSEEFDEGCVVDTVKHGGGSVMIWRCICGNETEMILRVETVMDRSKYLRVLEDGLVPSAWARRELDYTFMHNNTPCHWAHVVSEWLEEELEITVSSWPAQSPDLNPIENRGTIWRGSWRKYLQLQKKAFGRTSRLCGPALHQKLSKIWCLQCQGELLL